MTTRPGALDADAGPHCPACGFRVFNRRWPKCESCGAELPETIAYSPSQRHSLIEADAEAARQADRSSSDSVAATLLASSDDALVTALVDSTER